MPGPLEEQLREIRRVVTRLTERVIALESSTGAGAPTERATPAVGPETSPMPPTEQSPEEAGRQVREGGRVTQWVPSLAQTAEETDDLGRGGLSIDWDVVLGRNWFAIVGAVALTLGMGFFLRLAFENNWIGETGRVVLGIGVGLALLAGGEYAQRRYPIWAQAVTGGGIAVSYLSIYSAFAFYQLISPVAAFSFLGLVVLVSGLLALRYESLVIALLGIAGAFLTPLLLARDLPDTRLLLAYILLVDLGILGVSTFRNWRWFTLVGLIGSYLLFGLWLEQVPNEQLLLAQAGLTGIFLIFVGATTLFHLVWRRAPQPTDMALMTLNALAFYGNTFGLLWEMYETWFGLITLALSLFYGLVGYGAIKRSGAPPQVALFSAVTALVFLTVAVPLQLSGSWITVAWAAEGAALLWVGFLLRSWPTRAFGLGVFAFVAFRLLVLDTPIDVVGYRLFVNARFPTFVVAIAMLYVAAYLYRRNQGALEEWERYLHLVLTGAASFFTLWVLSAETISFFESRARVADTFVARQTIQGNMQLALTALWSLYSAGLLAVALGTKSPYVRWGALAVLALAVGKALLVDTFAVRADPSTFVLGLNVRFLTFILVLAVVVCAALVFRRLTESLLVEERDVALVLTVVANAVAFWALSAEAVRFFEVQEARTGASFTSAMHMTLTVLWSVYAIAVIVTGMLRNESMVRLAGVALLGVPVAKLFLFDVFLLERGYRVAAFVSLGVMLLSIGLLYQRYSGAVRLFLFGKTAHEV